MHCSLVGSAHPRQHFPKPLGRVSHARFDLQRFGEAPYRILIVAVLGEHNAELVMRLGEQRVGIYRRTQGSRGFAA